MGRGWEPIARHMISENKFLWGELSVNFNVLHIMPFLIWPQLTFHDSSLVTFPPNSLHTDTHAHRHTHTQTHACMPPPHACVPTHTHTHTHTHTDSIPGRPTRLFDSLLQASQSFHEDVSDPLVGVGGTEISKTWLDHLVEEIKSNRRSTWSYMFNRNIYRLLYA